MIAKMLAVDETREDVLQLLDRDGLIVDLEGVAEAADHGDGGAILAILNDLTELVVRVVVHLGGFAKRGHNFTY